MGSQLFTTSSPLSPVPSPVSDKTPRRFLSTSHYRISQYYDGRVVRVQESRRRPHVIGQSKHSMAQDFILFDTKSSQNTDMELVSNKESSHPRRRSEPTSMQLRPLREKHVTRIKPNPPRSKAQAVIIHAPSPASIKKSEAVLFMKMPSMATPPPTPKLGRLSTPEFADLDDALFCDCCVKGPIVKYCMSCGCSLYETAV